MSDKQAWIVGVDMGYGHQRAAFPLRHLSPTGKVISANNYQGIPKKDYRIWHQSESFYNFISRLVGVPIIGRHLFNIYDKMQSIKQFYPRRDLSRPNIQLRVMYSSLKKGWGKDLINYLNTKDIPLITTFFAVSFMAEEHGFKNDIYCMLCDADISRTWVSLNPQKSRIKYLAPCRRVVDRLKLYGVKDENIFLTGFPLPEENLGSADLGVLKEDLISRIHNLDPLKRYRQKFSETVAHFLKIDPQKTTQSHPLTLTFAVGGAGAQKGMAADILVSLKKRLLKEDLHLNLVAGTRNDVYLYFQDKIKECGLKSLVKLSKIIVFFGGKYNINIFT